MADPTGSGQVSEFQLQSTRNLLRIPAQSDQILNLLPLLRRHLPGKRRGLTVPLCDFLAGLKGIVATRNRIPLNFQVVSSMVVVGKFGNVLMRLAT